MFTVRHIEKLWDARKYQQLLAELLTPRVEASASSELAEAPAATAAALCLIRLDEMHLPHAPIAARLIRAVISPQEADGGWGDVAVTALCLRALSLQNGQGIAIERGMAYLAALQQPEGIWPKIPIRRMPADPLVSAFIMLQLADNPQFHLAVDFDSAFAWFESHHSSLDSATQALWDHARLRVPAHPTTRAVAEPSWS